MLVLLGSFWVTASADRCITKATRCAFFLESFLLTKKNNTLTTQVRLLLARPRSPWTVVSASSCAAVKA
jgi:hypothetical protein